MANKMSIIGATSLILSMSLLLSPFVPAVLADDDMAAPLTNFEPAPTETVAPADAAKSNVIDDSAKPKKEKKKKKTKKDEGNDSASAGPGAKSTTADNGKAPAAEEAVNKTNGEEGEIRSAKVKKKEEEAAAKEAAKEEKKDDKSASVPDPSRPFAPEAIRNYNQGVELQQQGFLNQAIQKYKAALEADDRIERAYCNLGLIYIAQKNFSKANDAFRKALAIKPNNPFSLNGMGSVYYSKGKLQDAMERWKKAVEVDPNFFSAYFNMANAWKNERDLDKALENYVMTIKTSPNMADAYYEVGMIFQREKHPAQAQCMLAKAVQLAPDGDFVADAKKQLGSLQNLMGKEENDGEVKMNVVAPPSNNSGKESESEESNK